VCGAGQAAARADVTVTVRIGSAPGTLDWQLADQSFPGLDSVRLQLQGQTIPSITCPSGWTSQVSPTSGASCVGGSLGAGGTMAGTLAFGGSLPPTAGILTIGNSTGTEQIPFTIAGSSEGSCTCIGLTASIDPASIRVSIEKRDDGEIKFRLRWRLVCSAATAGGCEGSLTLHMRLEGKEIYHLSPNRISVDCPGPCGKVEHGERDVTLGAIFTRDAIAGKRLELGIGRTCGTRRLLPEDLFIDFDRVGRPDRTNSKLH
jgi:hypothetical protein